jgi:hypothetical protein
MNGLAARSTMVSPDAEAFFAGFGDHALVPGRIPNDLHVGFFNAGNGEQPVAHLKAIADEIGRRLRDAGMRPHHRDG